MKVRWMEPEPQEEERSPCPARHPDYPDVPCEWWAGHEVEDGFHTIFVFEDGEPEVITFGECKWSG